MKEIQSIKAKQDGSPTFKNSRITIAQMLRELAHGMLIEDFCAHYDISRRQANDALYDIAENIYSWMRPERTWELWVSDEKDDSHESTFAPLESITDMLSHGMMDTTPKRKWVVKARSYIEAQIKYNEYMGYEPYQPMLDENGIPYSEDEGDTL